MSGFAFADAAPFVADANEVHAELDRIRRTGELTPKAVLAVAKPRGSVLHPLIFNVPKELAAERYYLSRATTLINSIRVVNEQGEVTTVRAFALVTVGESREYRGIDEEAARAQRAAWLRGRLLSIKAELRELDLYPQVALAIEETLAA